VQRLLWASTSTKDPKAPDDLYVHALGAPLTINTMPEDTLKAFHDHGHVGKPMPTDGGDSEATLAQFREAGVDIDALAEKLQDDGGNAFVDSWTDLIGRIKKQSAELTGAGRS
jgi:transaldolase